MLLKTFGSFSLIFGILSSITCHGANDAENPVIKGDYVYIEKDKQGSKEDTENIEKSEAAANKNKVKLEEIIEKNKNNKDVSDSFFPADEEIEMLKDLYSSSSNLLLGVREKQLKDQKLLENRRFSLIINPLLMLAWCIPFFKNWGPLKRCYNFWHYKDNNFLEVLKRMLEVIFFVDFLVIFAFISLFISRYGIDSDRNRMLLSVAGLCGFSPLMSRIFGMVLAETWNKCALTFIFGVGTTQFLTSTVNVIRRCREERRHREMILVWEHIADQ